MSELIVYIVFLLLASAFSQDPCTNYKLLNDPHRSSAFVPMPTDRLLCDQGLDTRWYRFGNNQDMPTTCVPKYHCGTNAPVWLNGKLPALAEGEAPRTACINYGYSGGIVGTTCCNHKLNIKVKKCNGYYVYLLTRVPGCSIAYCAGTKPVCNIGAYNTNLKTCQVLYPKMTQFPELLNPEVVNVNVRFPCKINYPKGEPGVAFTVMWNVDGHILLDPNTKTPLVTTLTGDQRIAYLDANYLAGHMGKNLHCNVTSYYQKIPNIKSDRLQSNPYWCGIKVSKTSLTVDEKNPEQEIILESTLPVPCRSPFPQDCKIRVEMKATNDPKDVSTSKCTYELVYDPNTKTYRGTVKIKATRDFIDDKNRNHELIFRPIFDINQPMWMGYNISHVQIHTVDKASGWCQGTGDPHWIGLDKGHYNTYEVGDFVMYRSTKRDFEVQVRTWACGKWKPCICGVVVKEGNDIVRLDMCERRRNQLAEPEVKSLSSHPLEETTIDTDKSGKHFYINFASGARVKIDTHVSSNVGSMNVFIQSPSDDFQGTEGLCGTWTMNKTDDFKGPTGAMYKDETTFSHSWRIKTGFSLFHQQPPYDPVKAKQPHYCRCGGNGDVDCTKGKGANNPAKGKCAGPCVNMNGKLHPRSFDDAGTYPESKERYLRNVVTRTSYSWPTQSGITQDMARTMCVKGLKGSSLYQYCGDSNPNLPFEAFVDGCVEDILYADGDEFVLAHMNALDNACQDTIYRNISNYKQGSNGELVFTSTSMVENCPNNCNRQGKCVRGSCVCSHGYTSVDCSVPVGVAPVIDHIKGDGICDIRQKSCTEASVIATNLWSSPHLKCRYRRDNKVNGVFVPQGGYSVTNAVFKTFLEVVCALPQIPIDHGQPEYAFSISVTTDGQRWSKEDMFVVYDSKCIQCDTHKMCTTKNDTCLINGQCHLDGEQTGNNNLMCKPYVSQTSWSQVPGIKEIDTYTASFTGCRCPHKPSAYNCACCQNGGCPCGAKQPNQCTHCEEMVTCGLIPELFPPHH